MTKISDADVRETVSASGSSSQEAFERSRASRIVPRAARGHIEEVAEMRVLDEEQAVQMVMLLLAKRIPPIASSHIADAIAKVAMMDPDLDREALQRAVESMVGD